MRPQCGITFESPAWDKKKYCSSRCSAVVNNTLRVRKRARCGNIYCNEVSQKASNYCKNSCRTEQMWLEKSFTCCQTGYPPTTSVRSVKNLVEFLKGYQCSIPDCGISTWKGGPVPLVMDHEDGDSTNNHIDNLRLVCGNCDMLLPTYKSKNKGNGRHSRRVRYSEGKSY